MRRVPVVLAAVAATLIAPVASWAHGGQTGGTDYRSTVRSAPAGVAARVVGGDDRLAISRTSAATVLIPGYGGEPYLRLDAQGTWENRNSPAVALNDVRRTAQPITRTGPSRAVRWVRTGTGSTVVFHDHRAHWMGSQPPAAVRADPSQSRTLYDWSVPVVVDGAAAEIRGDVAWVAPPTTWLWWIVTALLAAGALALGLASRVPAARLGIAGTIAAVGAAIATGVSQQLDVPDGTTGAVLGLAVGVGLLLAGLAIARRLRATPALALTVLLLVALVAGAVQLLGLADTAFAYGVIPGPLPALVTRLLVGAGLAGVALTAGACGRAWRDSVAPTSSHAQHEGAAW